ncbi:hypothetical protein C8F04DRAFT_1395466 [Mycena alexandri]|uniref:Uncharacterized protein n=1 Tax=Mycena alexandri TaxID=1745969 RepID=A0AAD6SZ54_9AGAR|nr:hypothetical protein C8F04DRAFT_1395466 [Mycena alexandri]
MENDALPPEKDLLARLRAQEFTTLELKAQIDVLKLTIAHQNEDLAVVQKEHAECKTRCGTVEADLALVRFKYDNLKRKCAPPPPLLKRKFESGSDGVEARERESLAASRGEHSPVEGSSPLLNGKLPDTLQLSRLGDPIVRKTSVSSMDEQESVWPRSPVVAGPGIPSSSSFDRTNDPRKRQKTESTPSSPDLKPISLPSASDSASPMVLTRTSPASIPPPSASASPAHSNATTLTRFLRPAYIMHPHPHPHVTLPPRPTGTPFPPPGNYAPLANASAHANLNNHNNSNNNNAEFSQGQARRSPSQGGSGPGDRSPNTTRRHSGPPPPREREREGPAPNRWTSTTLPIR